MNLKKDFLLLLVCTLKQYIHCTPYCYASSQLRINAMFSYKIESFVFCHVNRAILKEGISSKPLLLNVLVILLDLA